MRQAWLAHSLWSLAGATTGGAWLAAAFIVWLLLERNTKTGDGTELAKEIAHWPAAGTASPPAIGLRMAWLERLLLRAALAGDEAAGVGPPPTSDASGRVAARLSRKYPLYTIDLNG